MAIQPGRVAQTAPRRGGDGAAKSPASERLFRRSDTIRRGERRSPVEIKMTFIPNTAQLDFEDADQRHREILAKSDSCRRKGTGLLTQRTPDFSGYF
jgi:hypothetical protein